MKKIISLILVVTMLFIGSGFAQAEDILGDADGNGRISSNDALVVLQNTVKKQKWRSFKRCGRCETGTEKYRWPTHL